MRLFPVMNHSGRVSPGMKFIKIWRDLKHTLCVKPCFLLASQTLRLNRQFGKLIQRMSILGAVLGLLRILRVGFRVFVRVLLIHIKVSY